ncbi:MAG: acyl transferase [Williamsia sp.]|nr:acyl transferase [Williamsia sp.]
MESEWIDKIFSVSPAGFEQLALSVFRFQHGNNELYRRYVQALHVSPDQVDALPKIPFLPIRFFKSHRVATTAFNEEQVFESSGTTGMVNSRHYVKHAAVYDRSFLTAFEQFYGPVTDWCILALLPAYAERRGSSLTLMAEELIRKSGHPQSGFFLYEHRQLHALLTELEQRGQKTLLLGVTFALLDFAGSYPMQLRHTIVMETGGMKGRRQELTRPELHTILQQGLGVQSVHSEYGMTELLSQAYSKAKGIYHGPAWMRVVLREEEDPLRVRAHTAAGEEQPLSGVINVIDLANLYSCSFIATDDLGKLYNDGGFEVLGRIDNSDVRGCSLLVV